MRLETFFALAWGTGAWRPNNYLSSLGRPSRLGATIDDTETSSAASSGAPKVLKRIPRGARPTVAIIGRPNVGKSSLVNRLTDAGKSGAIAVNEAGVTRDRVYQKAEWCGRQFDVVDTGGLLFEDEEGALFLEEIREQATLALREACACVVVVDGRAGRTRLDDDIAAFLRKWPDKALNVVLAVNKCESMEREAELVAEFWSLGLGEPLACSAIHGNGVAEVLDALLPTVDAALAEKREAIARMAAIDARPHVDVCFLGRPNVGKSSLLNRFLGPGETRAIVSDVAGTTRDAVDAELDVDGTVFRFVDTAGVRRKARVTKKGTEPEMVNRALRTARLADVVLLVVDATQDLTDQDAMLAQRIADDGRACVVLANKWDAYEDKDEKSTRDVEKKIRETLSAVAWAEVVFLSAKTGQRCLKVYAAIQRAYESARTRVPTATLNEVVRDAMLWQAPPASVGSKAGAKIYFVSQTAVAPPTIVAMCNDPKSFTDNYKRYLERKVRESLPFSGTPVNFVFRARRLRDENRDAAKRAGRKK